MLQHVKWVTFVRDFRSSDHSTVSSSTGGAPGRDSRMTVCAESARYGYQHEYLHMQTCIVCVYCVMVKWCVWGCTYYVSALLRSQFWQISCQQSYRLWQKMYCPIKVSHFRFQALFGAIKVATKIKITSERSNSFTWFRCVSKTKWYFFTPVTRKLSKYSMVECWINWSLLHSHLNMVY